MLPDPGDCLSDDLVLSFAQGALSPEQITEVDEHLHGCARCRAIVAQAARLLLTGGDDAPAGEPARGGTPTSASIGRYVIETALGAGGNGVVYGAVDPRLKRRVALKLLRAPRAEAGAGARRERLLREAEAMARLSSPHVVPVHDAGVMGDHVYIVMELVEGDTLARWLRHQPRGWREILAVFLQAAQGLAAAHAAGLVHRDFKPENVLVGQDGRARVTDFGLAQLDAAPRHVGAAGRTGVVTAFAGTPLYMAPEQRTHGLGSAAADQFSFCVALYLALFGRHPYGLRAGLSDEDAPWPDLAEAPPGSELPSTLYLGLRKGLALDPAQRHPSVAALIHALTGDLAPGVPHPATPARAQRWAWALALLALAVSMALIGRWPARRTAEPLAAAARCGDGRIDPAEPCDDGNGRTDDSCLPDCRHARCGDGHLRRGVEECDDGNVKDGDGCSPSCLACGPPRDGFSWVDNGHCYIRHDTPSSYWAARTTCARDGGTLVTYGGTYESRAVRAALFGRALPPAGSWIGYYDFGPSRSFAWVTGEPTYLAPPWAPGEPDGTSSGCAFERPVPVLAQPADKHFGSTWLVGRCDQPRPFVCERAPWAVRPRDNHAYHLSYDGLSWPHAVKACARRGAHLATIDDADEMAFLSRFAGAPFWIGLSETGPGGPFRWVTDAPLRFVAFAPGEPEGFAGHDCAVQAADGWHDRYCGDRYPSVCEAE